MLIDKIVQQIWWKFSANKFGFLLWTVYLYIIYVITQYEWHHELSLHILLLQYIFILYNLKKTFNTDWSCNALMISYNVL